MKKLNFLAVVILFLSLNSKAQYSKYIIRFKDKSGTPFSINDPSKFLSARAIERRRKQHINIDETDLPVNQNYIDSVRLSGSVTILDHSKWLNQVCIETTDASALDKINHLSFVIASQPLMRPVSIEAPANNKFNEQVAGTTTSNGTSNINDFYTYGNATGQIHIHEGEYLHNMGFHGEGMLMAILDAGFYHYLSLPAFDSVRTNGQVKETYDFVKNETSVDEDHQHGMQCFSIIAGNIPGQLVGSCPKASYYLYRTEDVSSESPVEEQYWAVAAERADSLGVDVISTSLGYNTFDNPVFNHTYADLDGNTTIIARAADFAAKKGILVLAAAGNEGNKTWHFITTPADADSVLTVAAVDASGVPAPFSSYGPSSDGRTKPTVASVGVATALSSAAGAVSAGNGTSYATPNLAGLVTCLWQAFPDFTNMDIIQAVKKSSSSYTNPDDRVGYGIPNFRIAYEDLAQQRLTKNTDSILGNKNIKIFPNPFRDKFSVLLKPSVSGTGVFALYTSSGKLLVKKSVSLQQGQSQFVYFNNMQSLSRGIYILKYADSNMKQSFKLALQ